MKAHVLLIDDELGFSQLLSLYLAHKGLEVTTATTGEEARALIEKGKFDSVILDPNLSRDDGLQLLAFCKSKAPALPVLILARLDADEAVFRKCLSGRVEGILRKAGGLDKLLTEVRRHLPAEVPQEPSTGLEMLAA